MGAGKQAVSQAGTSRLYKSPFLPLNTGGGQQSTTIKSFDYKEFHRSGSVTAPRSGSETVPSPVSYTHLTLPTNREV